MFSWTFLYSLFSTAYSLLMLWVSSSLLMKFYVISLIWISCSLMKPISRSSSAWRILDSKVILLKISTKRRLRCSSSVLKMIYSRSRILVSWFSKMSIYRLKSDFSSLAKYLYQWYVSNCYRTLRYVACSVANPDLLWVSLYTISVMDPDPYWIHIRNTDPD